MKMFRYCVVQVFLDVIPSQKNLAREDIETWLKFNVLDDKNTDGSLKRIPNQSETDALKRVVNALTDAVKQALHPDGFAGLKQK